VLVFDKIDSIILVFEKASYYPRFYMVELVAIVIERLVLLTKGSRNSVVYCVEDVARAEPNSFFLALSLGTAKNKDLRLVQWGN